MTHLPSHSSATTGLSAAQAAREQIRLLNQIARSICERQDLGRLLQVVLRQLEERLAVNAGIFFLFDEGTEALKVTVLHSAPAGRWNLAEGATFALAETGLQACRQGEQVYWAGLQNLTPTFLNLLVQAQLRSAAATPVLAEGRLLGVLLVARAVQEGFPTDELEFLRTLSEHIGLAAFHSELQSQLPRTGEEFGQTEKALQQERLKALSQMASGIAHDLNNALSPVIGFADLISRSEKGLSENGRRYLQLIKTAGEDMANIVARLRHFYRRRGPREAVASINLNRVAQQVVEMTRPRWADIPQGLGLTVELQTDCQDQLPHIMGNEGDVREALTNLIFNAVDALPQGGKIVIRTRSNQALGSGDNSPAQAIVEVCDNGIGMDEATRKQCLEPFFSTKGKRGTGLGLAMVYGIVDRHEGRIEIETEVGKGTIFRLVFPARKIDNPAAAGSHVFQPA